MNSTPPSGSTASDPTSASGVPVDYDTDGDPDNMNPRSGDSAQGSASDDPADDTDADPRNMNPRHDASSQG